METDEFIKEKIMRERSSPYPSEPISDCLEFVTKIYRVFPVSNTKFSRDDIAAVVGKAKPTLINIISSCVQYGLLIPEKEKETFRIDEIFKIIYSPLDDWEKSESLLKLFKRPKLYAGLLERYSGNELPEVSNLKTVLFRVFKITESAAPLAVKVLLENAKYVGVLDDNNIFGHNENSQVQSPHNNNKQPEIKNSNSSESENTIGSTNTKATPLLAEMNNSEKDRIKLTEGRYIDITYPLEISATDYEIFQLWLNAFGLRNGIKNKSTL